MGVALRGEVTLPAGSTPNQPKIDENLDKIQSFLLQFIRLTRPQSQIPTVTISQHQVEGPAQDATAPWSWTAAEAASAEAALLPFLVRMAAARDDLESMTLCLAGNEAMTPPPTPSHQQWDAPGGIVNYLDPASGRSPLHVAALNGSTNCAGFLLKSGASVHLRDSLGHTALYYARLFSSLLDRFPC
jgi:60kDa lysophospholipase